MLPAHEVRPLPLILWNSYLFDNSIKNCASSHVVARSPLVVPHAGPAISSQTSKVLGGNDITGIANGLATAQGGNYDYCNEYELQINLVILRVADILCVCRMQDGP